MPRSTFLQLSLSSILLLSTLGLGGCFGSVTGGVDKVIAEADRSDPVRAAVVAALGVIDQDFEPLLGAPLSQAERDAMIDNGMKFKGMSQSQSSLDLLRVIEAQADNARHVNLEIPGAEALFYKTEMASGSVQGTSRFIEWRFPVEFEQRNEVAADLVARVAPLFAADAKWNRVTVSDPEVNPLAATTSWSVFLEMSVSGASEFAMVSVDAWHERENHEAMKGVRLYVSKINSRTN